MTPAIARCCLLLSLTWALCPPVAHAEPSLRRTLDSVEQLFDQWQVEKADQALQRAKALGPPTARHLRLSAELLFLRGDYSQALELARQAVRRQRGAQQARTLRKLIQSTREVTKGYVPYTSPKGHFQIWTSPGKDQLLAPFAAETLEAMLEVVAQTLGQPGTRPIRVEIYPRAEDLARVSPLTKREIKRSGTIALCKYNRLMIISPSALPHGYAWRDTLAHEFMHLSLSRISLNRIPVWLQEGLAKRLEAAWRSPAGTAPPLSPSQEHLLAKALQTNSLISWRRMYPSMAKLPNQRSTALAFAQVQTAIDFLIKKSGIAGIQRLIRSLRDGRRDWQAIKAATGMSRKKFSAGWKQYLRAMNLQPLPGLIPPVLRLGKAPTRDQRIAAIKEKRARDHLRLADMLRSRKMTRAAIIEYQKARAQVGQRDELVANHLARAYLEIASPAQAISALLPVLEYYPEYPGAQVTMGLANLRTGNLKAARRHLEIALRINPFDPEIHCNLAVVLQSQSPTHAKRYAKLCRQLTTR